MQRFRPGGPVHHGARARPRRPGATSEEIRQYKAPPPEVSSEAFYETDTSKEYKRGFSLQCVSPLPIVFAEHVSAQGHWAIVLREYMRDYVHWATFGALCELLPRADNRVTLADETDRHGLRVAKMAYSKCENDNALVKAATAIMTEMHSRAGAEEAITINRYAHLVGGCRMAADERTGVVDAHLRSFAGPNLFITDGSVLPTQGSANPALTIMALAARAADYLASGKGPPASSAPPPVLDGTRAPKYHGIEPRIPNRWQSRPGRLRPSAAEKALPGAG